jgi:hypothetical protein
MKLAFRYSPEKGLPDPDTIAQVLSMDVGILEKTPYMLALEGETSILDKCAIILGPSWGAYPITEDTFSIPMYIPLVSTPQP